MLRSRRTWQLFGNAHLLAIAQALPALKRAALQRQGGAGHERDERIMCTPLGLALTYSVSAKRDALPKLRVAALELCTGRHWGSEELKD